VCLRNEEENETMRSFVLSLSFCVACSVLIACGGAGNENTGAPTNSKSSTNAPANSANSTAANTSTPANANAASANTAASTGTKIGVPECDDYLEKYEACVTGKVPAAARATFTTSMETTRKAWRDAAATPAGKAGLAQACKAASDAAKTAMKSYGCEF
jgi:hypothetical protein